MKEYTKNLIASKTFFKNQAFPQFSLSYCNLDTPTPTSQKLMLGWTNQQTNNWTDGENVTMKYDMITEDKNGGIYTHKRLFYLHLVVDVKGHHERAGLEGPRGDNHHVPTVHGHLVTGGGSFQIVRCPLCFK